jgi:hypothetical protein
VCRVLAAPPEQQQHVSPRGTSPVSPRRKHATSTRHESPPREESHGLESHGLESHGLESHGLGSLERGGTMTVTFGPKKEHDTLMALLGANCLSSILKTHTTACPAWFHALLCYACQMTVGCLHCCARRISSSTVDSRCVIK